MTVGGGAGSPRPAWGALALRGIGTNMARTAVTEGLGLVVLIVAARSLTVGDFGVFAIAFAGMIVVAAVVLDGLALHLARRPRPPGPRALSGVVVALVAVIAGTSLVATVAAVAVVGAGDWLWVAAGLGTYGLTLALRVPAVLAMTRTMRFSALAGVQLVEAVAVYGWALVVLVRDEPVERIGLGIALGGAAGALAALALARPPLTAPSLRAGRRALAGAGRDEAWVVLSQATGALLFPALGALGGTVLAGEARWSLSIATPIVLVTAVIGPVVYVPLSRLPAAAVGASAATMFRLFTVGVGAVAVAMGALLPWLIAVVFGVQWEDSRVAATLALCGVVVWSVATLARTVVQGAGGTRAVLRVQIVTVVCLAVLCVPALVVDSAAWVMVAYGLAHALALVLLHLGERARLPAPALLEALVVAVAAMLVAAAASALPAGGVLVTALILVASLAAFAAVVLTLLGRRLLADVALVRMMIAREADRSGLA